MTKAPADAGSRILERLGDGASIRYAVRYMAVDANGLWVPVALVLAMVLFFALQRRRIHPGASLAIATAAIHFAGMLTVYLSTPATLDFHLGTSAARTMASTRMALVVGLFFMLADLEHTTSPSAPAAAPTPPAAGAPRA